LTQGRLNSGALYQLNVLSSAAYSIVKNITYSWTSCRALAQSDGGRSVWTWRADRLCSVLDDLLERPLALSCSCCQPHGNENRSA